MATTNQPLEFERTQRKSRGPAKVEYDVPENRGAGNSIWVEFAKERILIRERRNSTLRLHTVIASIENAVQQTFILLNINASSIPSFTLDINFILNNYCDKWKTQILAIWKGPRIDKNKAPKKWEGSKEGFFKLCKNWADQHKYSIDNVFWLPIFKKLINYINHISNNNRIEHYLTYFCLYSLFSAMIGLPKSKLNPVLLNKTLLNNYGIKTKLKEIDNNLDIYRFQMEEIEKTQSNGAKKVKSVLIAAAVRKRCLNYCQSQLKFTNRDYNLFQINISFDKDCFVKETSPNISNKKLIVSFDDNRNNSNNNQITFSDDIIKENQLKQQNQELLNELNQLKKQYKMHADMMNYSGYSGYCSSYIPTQSSTDSNDSIYSIPSSTSTIQYPEYVDGNNYNYNDCNFGNNNGMDNQYNQYNYYPQHNVLPPPVLNNSNNNNNNNDNNDLGYGATRGISNYCRHSRYNPIQAAPNYPQLYYKNYSFGRRDHDASR